MKDIPPPFHLSLDDFLKGEGNNVDLDIDPIFGKQTFEEFLEEHQGNLPDNYSDNSVIFLKNSEIIPAISYYQSWYGTIMLSGNGEPIGCYLWSSLVLTEIWQGLGLGRELVITRFIEEGTNPVWNLDTPAYSPAGYQCHVSAWNHVQERYR